MTISPRFYTSEVDLKRIQKATAEWIAITGFRGYMNVSDIKLRLFNGHQKYNPGEIVRLWEDTDGRVIGWSMVYAAWNSYEALLHPNYRQHRTEMEMLDWAEGEIIGWMHKTKHHDWTIRLDVFEGDDVRATLLDQRGYSRQEASDLISTRSLDDPIPQSQLLEGFSIRSAQGEQEADKLVALINDSFGWRWTVEGYRQWMRSPGYDAENEMVVVAPDGRFAASCILLPDTHNQTGMFENVSTGSDFRRKGLAKALLYAGMQHMKLLGFTQAMIPHIAEPGPATALYASAGFQPTYKIYHYTRVVSDELSRP